MAAPALRKAGPTREVDLGGGSRHAIVPAFANPSPNDEADRRTVARASRIGLIVWPAFAALDAYMCFVAFPGAPFNLFVAYRVAVELVLFSVYHSTRDPTIQTRQLYRRLNLSYGIVAMTIALMAVDLGEIRSPYMHGISIIALIRADGVVGTEAIGSEALRPVMARCVAPRPDDRIQSVRELSDALAAIPVPAPWTRDDAEAFWQAADRARFR
jgi:hypothetical protein